MEISGADFIGLFDDGVVPLNVLNFFASMSMYTCLKG